MTFYYTGKKDASINFIIQRLGLATLGFVKVSKKRIGGGISGTVGRSKLPVF